MDVTRSQLQRISALLSQRTGMAFPEARWPFLRCRLQAVMARRGTGGTSWMGADGGPIPEPLYADLEEALRVPETCFFRYERHHRALRDLAVPAGHADGPRGHGRPFRIWSVGCSSGEEPYSIAMTMQECLGGAARGQVEIVAVDANRAALTAARRGTYTLAQTAALPSAYVTKYFQLRGDEFAVRPALRDLVSFYHQDVLRCGYLGKFDAIFCCNVLLYYTADAQRRILERFGVSLHRGGLLFVGHADGITPPPAWFAPAPPSAGFAYRRA